MARTTVHHGSDKQIFGVIKQVRRPILLSKWVVPQRGGFKVQSDETRTVDLPPLRPLPKE
jgi:hypothetical protein